LKSAPLDLPLGEPHALAPDGIRTAAVAADIANSPRISGLTSRRGNRFDAEPGGSYTTQQEGLLARYLIVDRLFLEECPT
jgi:hypothetical protein